MTTSRGNIEGLDGGGVKGLVCGVTGGSGLVGRRLVEMLVERGCKKVISFDVRPSIVKEYPDMNYLTQEQERAHVEYVQGDITKVSDILEAFKDRNVDVIFHIAAVVGPYHPLKLYHAVNYVGTLNVIDVCKELGIKKLVAASSPSTRFFGTDINGARASELPIPGPDQFVAPYAKTKAMGEVAVRKACSPSLFTINVAPHQVYGPRDSLFLPNFLDAANSGKLRVLGNGKNLISMTHVDNYCHGLMISVDTLYQGSPTLGKFYIITDGNKPQNLWKMLDSVVVELGFQSLFDKFKVPAFVIFPIAYMAQGISWLTGIKFRLTPFAVRMLVINRYFDITDAEEELNYKPVYTFEKGWRETIDWFKSHNTWWKTMADRTAGKNTNKKA